MTHTHAHARVYQVVETGLLTGRLPTSFVFQETFPQLAQFQHMSLGTYQSLKY